MTIKHTLWIAGDEDGETYIYPALPKRLSSSWAIGDVIISLDDIPELSLLLALAPNSFKLPTWSDEPIPLDIEIDISNIHKPTYGTVKSIS